MTRRRDSNVDHFIEASGEYELNKTKGVFTEQIVRPTGLVDPICEIRKASNQVEDVIEECKKMKIEESKNLLERLIKQELKVLNGKKMVRN